MRIRPTLFTFNAFPQKCFIILKSTKFLLLIFTIIANVSTLTVQGQKKHGLNVMFFSDSTSILVDNNFIHDVKNVKYQPYDIKMPFQDFYFDIYGSQLVISSYHFAELMNQGGFQITGSYRDTLKQDTPHLIWFQSANKEPGGYAAFEIAMSGLPQLFWDFLDTGEKRKIGEVFPSFTSMSAFVYETKELLMNENLQKKMGEEQRDYVLKDNKSKY